MWRGLCGQFFWWVCADFGLFPSGCATSRHWDLSRAAVLQAAPRLRAKWFLRCRIARREKKIRSKPKKRPSRSSAQVQQGGMKEAGEFSTTAFEDGCRRVGDSVQGNTCCTCSMPAMRAAHGYFAAKFSSRPIDVRQRKKVALWPPSSSVLPIVQMRSGRMGLAELRDLFRHEIAEGGNAF